MDYSGWATNWTFKEPSPVDYSGPVRQTVVMGDNFFNHIHHIFKYLYVFTLIHTFQEILKTSLSKVSEILPVKSFLSWLIKYLNKTSSPSSPPVESVKGECFNHLNPHSIVPVHKTAFWMFHGDLGDVTCTIAYRCVTVHGLSLPPLFHAN